ncbi:Serine/threonine-protein phosphatase 4 regulatory subunit 4 [Orchesella cincta]|uniref:Serine/threonine-protein phosphatase 4 regulatory subunit 4 n=1 Tax=Orchesella cincta TaxID=48709 RepID=A0A1D2N7Z7_ORCCI|nr:Serine/threonine-protein phosphatase 4 regulatory subunit 4 [Orchesella cincta]
MSITVIGFAQGRSVHDRMLFLYMAKKIMERFSRMYFRDHFFEDVLVLANDPIINVRRKVMELMPELKGVTEDPALQQKVDAILHKSRRSEVDRDMKGVIEELLSKMNGKKDKDSKRSTKAAAAEPKPKDPDDEKKELEEAFIESLEIDVGKAVSKTTVKEKRKSFFGSTKRKSVTNEDGNGNLPSLPMFQKAAAASNK